jgi:transcriptional regulator with XRE-family HTH domain
MLARFRNGAGLSQRALARGMGFSLSLVQRSEAGERPPANAGEVLRIADVLGLETAQTDALLISAGHWPRVFLELGPEDSTLRTVAAALLRAGAEGGDGPTRPWLRRALEAVAAFPSPTPGS